MAKGSFLASSVQFHFLLPAITHQSAVLLSLGEYQRQAPCPSTAGVCSLQLQADVKETQKDAQTHISYWLLIPTILLNNLCKDIQHSFLQVGEPLCFNVLMEKSCGHKLHTRNVLCAFEGVGTQQAVHSLLLGQFWAAETRKGIGLYQIQQTLSFVSNLTNTACECRCQGPLMLGVILV